MKCNNCGFEYADDCRFCTNCGASADAVAVNPNPAAAMLLPVLRDNLFLAFCILMSVAAVFSFDVLTVLFAIFFWLVFAKSRKGIVDADHLRQVSGTVYAGYVITNVVTIIMIVCGALTIGGSILAGELLADSSYTFADIFAELDLPIPSSLLYTSFTSLAGCLVGLLFIALGVAFLIINVLGMKKLHAFAKSVYTGVQNQTADFTGVDKVKNWLIFYAVCEAISALSSGTALVVYGCKTAAIIITIVLIKKYFLAGEHN